VTLKLKGSDPPCGRAGEPEHPVGWSWAGKIDPAKVYDVATLDSPHFGGDGLELEKADKEPGETGRARADARHRMDEEAGEPLHASRSRSRCPA
jgi:hypothetical protein